MEKRLKNKEEYFAAANSYEGFKSNFDRIFSPLILKKLFILKGGPGTGKSTLMRKIAERFDDAAMVTRILCSSDTSSLDGVVLEKDGVTVGIVDGTAPHIVEPKFPGAVEEIINLGDGFDYDALMSCSKEIIELSEKKSNAYKKAYVVLENVGVIYRDMDRCFEKTYIYKEAEMIVGNAINRSEKGENSVKESPFLISAFSKDGYTVLPFIKQNKDIKRIGGDGISEYIFMCTLLGILKERNNDVTLYYSPLSHKMIDAIETDEVIYVINKKGEFDIDTEFIAPHSKEYKAMRDEYQTKLNQASDFFKEASVYHFKLEQIYSKNVSFELNESKKIRIIDELERIFNK